MNDPIDKRILGLPTATGVVIASMVGTGIFSAPGFVALQLDENMILLAWIIGGVTALAGALSYGELGAMMPAAGGDFLYVRRAFGPIIGYLAGFVTFVAGFAVPIAAVSLNLGGYLGQLVPIPPMVTATVVIVFLSAIHSRGVRSGARVNDVAAGLKVMLFAVLIVAGFGAAPTAAAASDREVAGVFSAVFGNALITIAFAYTGWNAAAYLAGELRRPEKTLPRALVFGTVGVAALYLLINLVYLRAASPAEMAGSETVGAMAAERLFGESIGRVMTAGIVLLLFSTASAFVMAGPRVVLGMAERGEVPNGLGVRNERGAPGAAVFLQGGIALIFVFISGLREMLELVGFLLGIFASLAVIGLMVLRRREPHAERPFRVPLYPLTPMVFLVLSAAMVIASISVEKALYGIAILVVAVICRVVAKPKSPGGPSVV